MKWKSEFKHPEDFTFVIEQETLRDLKGIEDMEGFYVYVWDGNRRIHDYLQNNLVAAKNCVFRRFGVPDDSWVQVEE